MERYYINRLREALACRNKNRSDRGFYRYEIKMLIRSIRNERNGKAAKLRALYMA